MKKRRIHIVITTVLIGVFLWLSVSLREQYQITVSAPLTIQEIPEGMAIRTPVPRSIQLRFRGDGWRLASLLLGPDMQVNVPLSALPQGSRTLTINEIIERLPLAPGVQLLDVKPETVAVWLDRLSEKQVPVQPQFTVSFKEGFGQVGTISVSPESVLLIGAESALAQISAWKTTPTRFVDLKAPVEEIVPLAQSDGPMIRCSPSTVRVRINVQPFAEKVFSGLPVEIRFLAPNREVIFIPPKIEVVARGGIRQLASILPVDFQVSVPYERIVADTTGTIEPDILGPSGIQIVSRRPERLQYIVRKRL